MGAAMTRPGERGTSLIEVMIASGLLIMLMGGLMAMSGLAISTTENQGHLAARATEYAQDKMEQLLSLQYQDTTSDTRGVNIASSGGSGLAVGGSYNVDSPVATYVDYLDDAGNMCGLTLSGVLVASCPAWSGTTPPTGWFYKRVWKVDDSTTDATLPANLKRITVATATSRGFGGGTRATSYLAVLKSKPF
jgi:Tfp pilus assembly protein PilV